jgi:primosomal protein N' (replication factor Y)
VSATPALVVATPGAEPVAEGGYAAALLLDGWALLGRADLRAAEEALRRWLAAAALVRPARDGGTVVVMGEPSASAVQALVRWDPVGHARRELAERDALGYPPAARVAAVTGSPGAVRDLLDVVRLPDGARVLGPTPVGSREEDGHRALIRVPRALGAEMAAALRAAQGVRSARKAADHARVCVDPAALG